VKSLHPNGQVYYFLQCTNVQKSVTYYGLLNFIFLQRQHKLYAIIVCNVLRLNCLKWANLQLL